MFGDRPTVGQRVLVSLMGVRALLPEPFHGACMKITEKEVLHTATLAHLHLSLEEITQTAENLKNSLRQDRSSESLSSEKITENTPSVQDPFIKVPKIIEV